MSEELSPQGDITENMPIEPGAATREAKAIAARSRALSRQVVGDESPEDRIRQRCAVAVGDFAMAGLLRFCNGPVSAGKKALDEGNLDSAVIACGQCVGLIHEIKTVKEVIEETVRDAQTLLGKLSTFIRKEP